MDMIYMILGLGVLSWLIALMRGTGMDKYLLSGYNTASEEERARMDKPEFIRNFKQFHFILGALIIVFGGAVYYLVDPDFAIMLSVIVMLLGYVFFFMNGQKYGQAGSVLSPKWATLIIIGVTVGVSALFVYGISANQLTVSPEGITIDGMFGEEIEAADIASVCVVDEIPEPRSKSKGFALSKLKKGWFINANGQNVKLLIENINSPILHIRTTEGMDIYYQTDDVDVSEIESEVLAQWPKVSCNE